MNKSEKLNDEELRKSLIDKILGLQLIERNLDEEELKILYERLLLEKKPKQIDAETGIVGTKQANLLSSGLAKIGITLNYMVSSTIAYESLKEVMYDLLKSQADKGKSSQKINNLPLGIKKLLDTSLQTLPFSTRIKSVCDRHGIIKVSDLVRLNAIKFLRFGYVGRKSIDEIEEFFQKNGLWWEMLE